MPKYFCSWSGGKDSCLALHRAAKGWGPPARLLNMLCEDEEHSRSHGLPKALLAAQAESLGVPITFGVASWAEYEEKFVQRLTEMRGEGVEAGVFGDIDLDVHREWENTVCGRAEMTAHLPIWHADHRALADEFLGAGFEALIVTINKEQVPERFLGRPFDAATLAELEGLNIDVCGEGGEFHTFVTTGPLFAFPVRYETVGVHHQERYATLELRADGR